MTWFKVDDHLHSNAKIRKVAAKNPAALALWLIAGSWSSDKLTEGFIGDDDLPWLIPGSETLASELVTARLWRRVKGGYQFHDWLDCNPSREQVEQERAAARERMRRLRSGEQPKCAREVRANNGRSSRPRSEVPIGTSRARVRGVPDWCGRCNGENRMAINESDEYVPCPNCHPNREAS